MKTITLPYWGQITGLVSSALKKDSRSLFITRQSQTAAIKASNVLYILDSLYNKDEQFSLSSTALPCAMQAIIKTSSINNKQTHDRVVMLGADGHLYQTDWQAKKITQVSTRSLLAAVTELSADLSAESSADGGKGADYLQALTYQSKPAQDKQPSEKSLIHPVAIALLPSIDVDNDGSNKSEHTLAILYPQHLVLTRYQNGVYENDSETISIYPLTDNQNDSNSNSSNRATALATSSDGKWLVIGDTLGFVSSYQLATGVNLSLSSRQQLHQGKVTALRFEPVSQHFFSAGTDKCLYRTHVQGELHPIDRAKSSQHSQMITALCVSDTRLFSASDDKSIKSWAFDKGQPSALKDDLVKMRKLAFAHYDEQPALIAIGRDESLRFVPIDGATSKLLPVAHIIKDGYQRVSDLLAEASGSSSSGSNETAFKEALALLQAQADNQTLDIVQRVLSDSSAMLPASRALELVHWIASTDLDKTTAILEQQLNAVHSSKVRLAAFNALAKKSDSSPRPLQYLEKAISSQYEEVVAVAIQVYLKVALQDEDNQRRILPILQDMLTHKLPRIRQQALASLEALLPRDSPRANLLALESRSPDMIQAGLIRLYQRDMLDSLEVTRQLMLRQADGNMEVRQTAFYVSVLSQPKLSAALKQQADAQGDTQLLRTLSDFDDFDLLRGTLLDKAANSKKNSGNTSNNTKEDAGNDTGKKADASPLEPHPYFNHNLSNETLEPLLQGLSNRYEDISFRAAYALACLHDRRAFGTLVRLIHHNANASTNVSTDASIRAGVASALGTLAMEDAKAVLPTLLNDKDASVRQMAMRSFGLLADKLSWVAAGFASSHQDIHEQALAIFLTQVLGTANQQGKDVKKGKNNKEEQTSAVKDEQSAADTIALTEILRQALNNPFTSIRLEVVKVLLNRESKPSAQTAIDDSHTIQRLQQSLYEDVHQVAIEEWQRTLLDSQASVQALKAAHDEQNNLPQNGKQAALTLLLADNFAAIRQQAFDIALKNRKVIPFSTLMLSALASPFMDIKKLALSTLQARANTSQLKALMPALVALLSDDSIELRGQALNVALALSDLQPVSLAFSPDVADANTDANAAKDSNINSHADGNVNDDVNSNEALISAALDSPYPDIQLTVAQLLASQAPSQNNHSKNANDKRAYAVFERYLDAAMPTTAKDSEDYKQWHDHVSRALAGLAKLSNPADYQALDWYAKYLNHADADFNKLAPNLMLIVAKSGYANDNANEPTDDPINAMDTLVKWQKDERALISQSASLALAVCGDARGQHFFNHVSHKDSTFKKLAAPLTAIQWLQARQGLGISHANQLQPLFESETYIFAARIMLIFNELFAYDLTDKKANSETKSSKNKPNRLIEALSFVDNETAVVYAQLLARYPQRLDESANSVQDMQPLMQPLWHYLSGYLSRKVSTVLSAHPNMLKSLAHDIAPTKSTQAEANPSIRSAILTAVSAPVLQQLATLSNSQQPLIKAQAVSVIGHLSELLACCAYDNDSDVLSALQHWQRSLQALWVTQNQALTNTVANTENKPLDSSLAYPYQTLAFGAWLGVIHADNDYYTSDSSTEQAIRGLLWLARQSAQTVIADSPDWQDSVSRALLPLLNHHSFDTRKLAWECLYKLETPTQKLAEYAMSTSHADMVKQGLHLLLTDIEGDKTVAKDISKNINKDINSAANQQLIKLLKTNNRSLAEETYQLLKQRLGHLPASLLALESYSTALHYQVVDEWQQVIVSALPQSQPALAEDFRQNKLSFLRQASTHDEQEVRHRALTQLLDFHEVLFADNTVVDGLFTLWVDAKTGYAQANVLSLIMQTLQTYQRLSRSDAGLSEIVTANPAPDSMISLDNIKAVADSTYSRLLGLLDSADLKMQKAQVYSKIANLRDTQLATPLLQRLQQSFKLHTQNIKKDERQQIFNTLVAISGYDQPIEDYLDEYEDERWLQRQHPRHPQVLLSLFTASMSYSNYEHAAQLLRSLAWAKDANGKVNGKVNDNANGALATAIDNALARAYEQLPSKYTAELVESLSYRADKRAGDLATLQKALSNKDADVQFLAAEALAKRGQTQGLNILMAAIDYNADGEMRRRSVLALGELMGNSQAASEQDSNAHTHRLYQAYDKLITLAEDGEHYLQDVASEALGRLAQSGNFEHSQHIFELLKANLTDPELAPYNPAIIHWLNGLRWLNTYQAWEQIRHYIQRYIKQDLFFAPQTHAIDLLQFSDNQDNKNLLLAILKHRQIDYDATITAYSAAQKLWGNEATTVYPYDWAAIHNDDDFAEEFAEDTDYLSSKRIINNSTIDELTAFITEQGLHLPASSLEALQNAILAKPNMPIPSLLALLTDNRAAVQDIALSYLTQYPSEYLHPEATEMFAALQQCFDTASAHWQTLIDTVNQSPTTIENDKWRHSIEQVATTIEQIIWLEMRYLPISKDKNVVKQVIEAISKSFSAAKNSQTGLKRVLYIIEWLSTTNQRPMVSSIALLSRTLDKWWQQALLALLARADANLLAPLAPALRGFLATGADKQQTQSQTPLSLSHSNQAYLATLLTRIEQSDIQANTDNTEPPVDTSAKPPISNQQLMQWLKDNNAAALYDCAKSDSTDTAVRVRALEALGQLHELQIEQWLKSLMQNEDEDIQKLAYKVLRRWQRAQVLAQKKRPSAFASMDNSNSKRQF